MLRKKISVFGLAFHISHGGGYIRCLKNVRTIGFVSVLALTLISILSIFPIISHQDSAEATPGVVEVPTLAMVVGQENANLNIAPTSSTGSFASSEITDEASFSVTTSNYTGYTLTVSAADDNGKLTNLSTLDTLDTITTATDATTFATGASSAYTNKWGIKPSKFNSLPNTDFIPSPTTTPTTLDTTTSANLAANNYTIGLGARVDYTKPSGTYTNTYMLTAIANPVAYHVEYWDLAGVSSTTLNDSGITWSNPTSGTAKKANYEKIADQSSSFNTGATITINPTYVSGHSTPTRHTYTFAGWCRNSTDHSKIGVNDTVTAIQNSSNKVTAYNNPSTMCNGVVPDYNTSTDNFIKAGDTTFKLDPTKDNTNVILTAVYKPTTFANAGIAANANMQSMTNAICKATTPNQFTTMRDSRDNGANTYTIIKLLDGNCWMADNLNFDAYTYKNNITASNTHATGTIGSTAITRFKTTTATTTDRYATSAINSNSTYASSGNWASFYSYSDPLINKSGKCNPNASDYTNYQCLSPYHNTNYTTTKVIDKYGIPVSDSSGTANITYNFGPGAYKIGTYYNYCAATLGSYCYGNGTSSAGTPSGNATDVDICPVNWRLPAGGTSGDYQNLNNKVSNITTTPNSATNLLSLQTMLSTPVSGNYHTSTAYRQGTYGYFWSSTYHSAALMYYMILSGTSVNTQNNANRYAGYSVRCIAQ